MPKKKADTKPRKKAVNGRKKGQTAERQLAKQFSKWWGSDFARTPLSGGFSTAKFREDWNAAGDLVTPDPTFPFCVESKKVEGWTLEQMLSSDKTLVHKWWTQTVKETPEGKIPLLVFTKNRSKVFCMIEKKYLRLYNEHTKEVNHFFDVPYFEMEMPTGAFVHITQLSVLLFSDKNAWIRVKELLG